MTKRSRRPAEKAGKSRENDQRYTRAYDWLWGNPPGNDGTPATLRLHVRDSEADRARPAVDAWLATLAQDADGVPGRGGWHVEHVHDTDDGVSLDLVSSGEDVAEAIEDAATWAHDALTDGTSLRLAWEELPRR